MNHTTLTTMPQVTKDLGRMTRNIKNYIHVFMFIGMVSQTIYTRDNNRVGTTKLIEFVKQRENELVDLDAEVADLWKKSIRIDINTTYNGNVKITTTTYSRQPFCTDKMLHDLYQSRKLLKNFEEDTKQQIAEIMKDNISIDAIDRRGKTALNYCKSRDVYNALRSQGAPFQIDSFSSINQYQLLATGLLAAAWAAFLAMTLMSTTPVDSYHVKNETINDRDENGRTPLMNYIIEQEIEIDPYRVGYTLSPLFLSRIKDIITGMVELGADLNIKDFEGKTVMDYCKTQAIYKHLHSLGAPVSFNAWLSCNQESVIGLGLFSVAVILGTIYSAQNYRGQDAHGLFIDKTLEKFFK